MSRDQIPLSHGKEGMAGPRTEFKAGREGGFGDEEYDRYDGYDGYDEYNGYDGEEILWRT